MTLEEKLEEIIRLKQGDKSISLYYFGEGDWRLMVGNESRHVMLGEVSGEFEVDGRSSREVVDGMLEKLRNL